MMLSIKPDGTPAAIAVKHIRAGDIESEVQSRDVRSAFQSEVQNLGKIALMEHEHIIETLLAISIGVDHYILFRWADGGSIRDLWRGCQDAETDAETFRELVRASIDQITGLADALVELHKRNLRHGDLKPDNILRFLDNENGGHSGVGTWKVADFGLAKQHKSITNRRPMVTTTTDATQHYESPDAQDALQGKGTFSRLADIWSIGCVVFEHVVWLLYGFKEVEKLNIELRGRQEQSRFFRRRGGSVEVHPTATMWMDQICGLSECRVGKTPLGDLLRTVQTQLVVVDMPGKGWEEDRTLIYEGKRVPARVFLDSMTKIRNEVRNSSSYCFAGNPVFPRRAIGSRTSPTLRETSPNQLLTPAAAEDIPRSALPWQEGSAAPRNLAPVFDRNRKVMVNSLPA